MLTFPFCFMRGLPADPQRVGVAEYRIPRTLNPNGLPRPSRIVSEAALTVGGDFRLHARIVRQQGGMALELCPSVFDMARQRSDTFTLTPELARACYDQMARAHVAEQARQHGRGVGRN